MKNNINEFYDKIKDNTFSVKSLGWGSQYSQEIRFANLIKEIDLNLSVLDVGCGYGDMSVYFNNYFGIDIREDAINEASIRYSNKLFKVGVIEDLVGKYDWVLSSGIFCHKIEDNLNYIKNSLIRMYDLCTIGISVNFLSSYSKTKNDNMYYASPADIMYIIENDLSKNYILKTNYLPNDFTFTVYKN